MDQCQLGPVTALTSFPSVLPSSPCPSSTVWSMLSWEAPCSSCFSGLKMLLPTCPLDSPHQICLGFPQISPCYCSSPARPSTSLPGLLHGASGESIHHLLTCSLIGLFIILLPLLLECKFHEGKDLSLFWVLIGPNFQTRVRRAAA